MCKTHFFIYAKLLIIDKLLWWYCFTLRTVRATSGVGQGKASLGVNHADHGQEGHCRQVRVPAHLYEFRKNINNNSIFLFIIYWLSWFMTDTENDVR